MILVIAAISLTAQAYKRLIFTLGIGVIYINYLKRKPNNALLFVPFCFHKS